MNKKCFGLYENEVLVSVIIWRKPISHPLIWDFPIPIDGDADYFIQEIEVVKVGNPFIDG